MVDKYVLYAGSIVRIAGEGHIDGTYVLAKDYARLRAALRGLVEKIQAEPMPTGEPSESVWLGRQQVSDELKAAIAAVEAETEGK